MEAKRLLRTRLLAARTARPPAEAAAAGAALAAHAAAAWAGRCRIAGFAAVGTEPPTRPLLDLLRERGGQVLLPVVEGQSMRWAPYEGWDALRPGQWDLLEPAGATLPPGALAGMDVVLAPALAVDVHGHRLGRGGGFYDRALAGVDTARVVAVVYDDEVLAHVPTERHDRDVGAVLTPGGLRRLTAGPSRPSAR